MSRARSAATKSDSRMFSASVDMRSSSKDMPSELISSSRLVPKVICAACGQPV
ncbi:hypothetical protein D3C78_1986780 [compost metagenome]